ncbi:MAG: bifunctional DNA-formamidopyrimidine glycosylase/DNA-(apurinic or apyrimidinic site) lyase [Clostridiales bacterium]|nr:bifunctional DNA-formamidopyrimidine glycosylase/DNA-(apurinic or apyrimidinic site) lyase [Clostridiales bacterium]
MPELPEIETVKRTLSPLLLGRRITKVSIHKAVVVAHPAPDEFAVWLTGATIKGLGRRGKYLLFNIDSGDTLIAHLRMTGRFLYTPGEKALKPHTHVVFSLDNGKELRFSDVRRFGRLWLIAQGEEDTVSGIHKLGPEPLSKDVDAAYYKKKLAGRRINIKQGLLDQCVVAGLGNIYVDEALFSAGIHPRCLTAELSDTKWQDLALTIPWVLQKAIENNGTTFRDYLDGQGNAGRNLPHLCAYGRSGQPCLHCGTTMERLVVAGRGTSFCPKCQKLNK